MAPTQQPALTREQQQAIAKARARARVSAGVNPAVTPPVRALDPVGDTARGMQKPIMDAMGAAVLGKPLPTQPPPPMDPLAKNGVSTGRNLAPGDPFNPRNAGRPDNAPAPQDFGALAEKAAKSIGGMIGGQRPESEALAQFGGSVVTDPIGAANAAIEAVDPIHQMANAYNDADAALKAGVSGDWNTVANELKDLSVSGSFAAMSFLPGAEFAKTGARITGAAGSTASKAASNIAGQVFKPGPTAADRAADILIKKMQADGLTWEDISKTARSLANRGDSGVYETLSEVAALSGKSSGANMRGLAMALGSVPGPAQEAILARVAENADKLASRTSRAASRATGQDASKAAATLDELETRLKTESGPLYQKFYDAPVDQQIYDAQISPVLNAPHGQAAMERAARGLGVEAASLQANAASGGTQVTERLQRSYEAAMALKNALDGKAAGPLPPLALDHVKRAFDDLIDEAGQGTYTGGNLRSAKRNFSESVSRATGGTYGDALGFYEGGKRLEEAFDIGLNALKQPTWQLERAMNKGNRGSPFSGGEVEAIAMGVARHIEDLIEANDQAALTKLLKGKALKNLSTALGDPKAAAKFEQSIQRLGANREWGRRVSGGSDTAMRLAAVDDASRLEEDPITRALDRAANSTAPPSIFGAAWQAVAKPAANAATDAYRRLKYPGIRDEGVNAALAPLMSQPLTAKPLDDLAALIEHRAASKGAPRLNAPKGPPPTKGSGGSAANAAGRTAAGAGAVTVSTINQADADTRDAQEELTGKITGVNGEIDAIKQKLKDFDAADSAGKQQMLKDAGKYPGKIDGIIGRETSPAIEAWKADRAKELTDAEGALQDLMRRDALQNTPDAMTSLAREVVPLAVPLAAMYGMKIMRGHAPKSRSALANVAKQEKNLNKPLTKGPVNGSLMNKADQNRASNLNQYWRKGGAGDDIPFEQNSDGKWKARPASKTMPVGDLYKAQGLEKVTDSLSKYFSPLDTTIILGGAVDAAGSQVFLDKANERLSRAEENWNNNPSDETFKEVEDAKNEQAFYNFTQRLGAAVAFGRGMGAIGKKYAKPQPDLALAESELAAIRAHLAKSKPPSAPRGGAPKLASAGPPPAPPLPAPAAAAALPSPAAAPPAMPPQAATFEELTAQAADAWNKGQWELANELQRKANELKAAGAAAPRLKGP